jgi:hypothetical protein
MRDYVKVLQSEYNKLQATQFADLWFWVAASFCGEAELGKNRRTVTIRQSRLHIREIREIRG